MAKKNDTPTLAERIEAARATLGDTGDTTPEEALARASAEAAERYVRDLERQAAAKEAQARREAERAQAKAEAAERRANKLTAARAQLPVAMVFDLLAAVALRRETLADFLHDAVTKYLENEPAALQPARFNGATTRPLHFHVRNLELDVAWNLAKQAGRVNVGTTLSTGNVYEPQLRDMNAGDVFTAVVAKAAQAAIQEARETRLNDFVLLKEHHKRLREASQANYGQGAPPATWEEVERYNGMFAHDNADFYLRSHPEKPRPATGPSSTQLAEQARAQAETNRRQEERARLQRERERVAELIG